MPLFVVLKHIKLSNLFKHKATNKEQLSQSRMGDQYWLSISVAVIYSKTKYIPIFTPQPFANQLGTSIIVLMYIIQTSQFKVFKQRIVHSIV